MALIPLLAAQHHDEGNACALVTRRKETSAPVLRLVTESRLCFPLITYCQPCLLLGLLWGPNGVLANKAGRDLGPACLSDPILYHFPSCSLHSSHTDSRQSSFLLQGLCTGCFLCLECSSFWSPCIWLFLGYSDPSLFSEIHWTQWEPLRLPNLVTPRWVNLSKFSASHLPPCEQAHLLSYSGLESQCIELCLSHWMLNTYLLDEWLKKVKVLLKKIWYYICIKPSLLSPSDFSWKWQQYYINYSIAYDM